MRENTDQKKLRIWILSTQWGVVGSCRQPISRFSKIFQFPKIQGLWSSDVFRGINRDQWNEMG